LKESSQILLLLNINQRLKIGRKIFKRHFCKKYFANDVILIAEKTTKIYSLEPLS